VTQETESPDTPGGVKYSPTHEDGNVYCEDFLNGDRFFLRKE
jgi:hypothetical protein